MVCQLFLSADIAPVTCLPELFTSETLRSSPCVTASVIGVVGLRSCCAAAGLAVKVTGGGGVELGVLGDVLSLPPGAADVCGAAGELLPGAAGAVVSEAEPPEVQAETSSTRPVAAEATTAVAERRRGEATCRRWSSLPCTDNCYRLTPQPDGAWLFQPAGMAIVPHRLRTSREARVTKALQPI